MWWWRRLLETSWMRKVRNEETVLQKTLKMPSRTESTRGRHNTRWMQGNRGNTGRTLAKLFKADGIGQDNLEEDNSLSFQFGTSFLTRACLTRSSWACPTSTRCQFGARQFGAFSQFGACQFDAQPFDAFYNGNRQHAAGTEADRKRDGGTT